MTMLVGSVNCPVLTVTDSLATCMLPAGSGLNLNVTIARGTQRSSVLGVSYAGPVLVGGTLMLQGAASPSLDSSGFAFVSSSSTPALANTAGGQKIQLNAQFVGTNASNIIVYMGPRCFEILALIRCWMNRPDLRTDSLHMRRGHRVRLADSHDHVHAARWRGRTPAVHGQAAKLGHQLTAGQRLSQLSRALLHVGLAAPRVGRLRDHQPRLAGQPGRSCHTGRWQLWCRYVARFVSRCCSSRS